MSTIDLTEVPWILVDDITADEFILEMLKFGEPTETSLVGVFGSDKGRGSTRDIALPFHKDGTYSEKVAKNQGKNFDKVVDYVGLYCIKSGETATQIKIDGSEEVTEVILSENQALIFDNNKCLHARSGPVGDRVLLRVWIKSK